MMNSTTFLNLRHGSSSASLTFTSEFAVLDQHFDIVNCLDDSEKINGRVVDRTNVKQVQAWFLDLVQRHVPYYIKKPPTFQSNVMLSLTQERPKNLAIQSLIHKEQHKYFRDYEDSAPIDRKSVV